jgi:hypothetical protein
MLREESESEGHRFGRARNPPEIPRIAVCPVRRDPLFTSYLQQPRSKQARPPDDVTVDAPA